MNMRWFFHGVIFILGAFITFFKHPALWGVSLVFLFFGLVFLGTAMFKQKDVV